MNALAKRQGRYFTLLHGPDLSGSRNAEFLLYRDRMVVQRLVNRLIEFQCKLYHKVRLGVNIMIKGVNEIARLFT